jgi:subtilisin family serine protease
MNVQRSIVRLAFALPCALLAAACDSGGGGGGGGGSFDGARGTLAVVTPASAVLEIEPNDDPTQAQAVGTLEAAQTLTILGATTDSGADPFDGFQLDAPESISVTATLDHDPADDFDLFVYDPVTQTILHTFATTAVPEVGTFTIQGTFQVVVGSFAGEGEYTLELDAVAADTQGATAPGSARFLGALYPNETLELPSAAVAADAPAKFLVSVPYDALVELHAETQTTPELTIALRDATESRLRPIERARYEPHQAQSTQPLYVQALTLLEIEVSANASASAAGLSLAAKPTPAPLPRARIAPLAAEAELARTSRRGAFYGQPKLRCMAGQALILPAAGANADQELELAGARELARIPDAEWKVGFELGAALSDEDAQRVTFAFAKSLAARKAFAHAEPNLMRQAQGVPDDSYYNLQWHYPQIQLPAAWDLTTGSNDIVVAVIDTGETQHPDIVSRLVDGYDFISDPQNAGDGNGVDPNPTDVGDGAPPAKPSSFHGTHVAGTIAAESNNASGIAGVTWLGKVQHVRVLGLEGGADFDISVGIRWAAGLQVGSVPTNATPAKVLNLSLGGPGFSQTSQNAVTAARNAGAVVVAAAGNNNSPNLFYPASYQNVISVSAVDLNGQRAPYSNFNAQVDLAAPGGDMGQDLNGDGYPDGVLSSKADDSSGPPEFVFAFENGTSMASPHVAGVAALMFAIAPSSTPAQIESALFTTATDLGPGGKDNEFGHGLVNAYQAVLAAQGGGGSTTPLLSLSTLSLAFTGDHLSSNVQVANIGGGLLQVGPPTVSTEPPGGGWLAASRITVSNPTTTDTQAIRVQVDPAGLAEGVHSGDVQVTSNGGDATIQVLLTISADGGLDVDLFVIAVEVESFETGGQAIVNPANGDLDWEIPDLAPGDYIIVAGSDDDGDGFIGGEGDVYLGLYPSLSDPEVVTKVEGEPLQDLDFAVASGFQSGLSVKTGHGFRLLATGK